MIGDGRLARHVSARPGRCLAQLTATETLTLSETSSSLHIHGPEGFRTRHDHLVARIAPAARLAHTFDFTHPPAIISPTPRRSVSHGRRGVHSVRACRRRLRAR